MDRLAAQKRLITYLIHNTLTIERLAGHDSGLHILETPLGFQATFTDVNGEQFAVSFIVPGLSENS